MNLNINSLIKKNFFLNKKNKYNKINKYIFYIYNDILLLDMVFIIKYLYIIYNYIYLVNKYKNKLLFINKYNITCNFIQCFSNITGNFYISTFKLNNLTNWKKTKYKLIVLKWLLNIFKHYKNNNFNINLGLKKLFNIYIILLTNYIGLYNINFIPKSIFYINYYKKYFIKNKIIISLSNVNNKENISNSIMLPCNNKNLHSIKYIFLVIASVYL